MTAKLIALPSDSCPVHLSQEAQRLFKSIASEYAIQDVAGMLLLQSAMEAYDRLQAARRAIAEDGLTTRGSKKQIRVHPLCGVERDARAQMLASLKALSLDIEPLRDRPGRPAGGKLAY
jgi:P27 family predicted phage terminase small subunit